MGDVVIDVPEVAEILEVESTVGFPATSKIYLMCEQRSLGSSGDQLCGMVSDVLQLVYRERKCSFSVVAGTWRYSTLTRGQNVVVRRLKPNFAIIYDRDTTSDLEKDLGAAQTHL